MVSTCAQKGDQSRRSPGGFLRCLILNRDQNAAGCAVLATTADVIMLRSPMAAKRDDTGNASFTAVL